MDAPRLLTVALPLLYQNLGNTQGLFCRTSGRGNPAAVSQLPDALHIGFQILGFFDFLAVFFCVLKKMDLVEPELLYLEQDIPVADVQGAVAAHHAPVEFQKFPSLCFFPVCPASARMQ